MSDQCEPCEIIAEMTVLLHTLHEYTSMQVIKTFSMRESWWYIKGDGGAKSKGTIKASD